MRRRTAGCGWVSYSIVPGVLLCLLFQPGKVTGQISLTDQQVRDKAASLLQKMTLDEKIAQLSQLPGIPAPEFRENVKQPMEDVLKQFGAGSILWVSDPKEINRLQHVAVEQTRLHIPVLFGLDVIHGYHTIFPAPIAMESSWDTKLVEDAQAVNAYYDQLMGRLGPAAEIRKK